MFSSCCCLGCDRAIALPNQFGAIVNVGPLLSSAMPQIPRLISSFTRQLAAHWRWWFRRPIVLGALVLLGLSLTARSLPGAIAQTGPEIRGTWLTTVDSRVLLDRQRMTQALDQLKAANFNTLYPVIWHEGYTLYPSAVAKQWLGRDRTPLHPELQNRDMLLELITQAHQRGLKVIPWFEFGLMSTPQSSLAKLHPDWLSQRADGSTVWYEGPNQTEARVWLSPAHPQVQQFLKALLSELAANYDLDGVQLDDHFGLRREFGYDPVMVQQYRASHRNQPPPTSLDDPEWLRWRASQVSELTRSLFRSVKAKKPKALFALSPNSASFSYRNFLQDWPTWERQGYVEELLLQVYRDNLTSFERELKTPEVQASRKHIPTGVGVLSGLRGKPVPLIQIRQQVALARSNQFAGVSLFFYETLWNIAPEPAPERINGFKQLFPTPVSRP